MKRRRGKRPKPKPYERTTDNPFVPSTEIDPLDGLLVTVLVDVWEGTKQ